MSKPKGFCCQFFKNYFYGFLEPIGRVGGGYCIAYNLYRCCADKHIELNASINISDYTCRQTYRVKCADGV